MEATGRDGGCGPWWSYREQPGSSSCTISSTSGTVSTTGYTSTGGSHLSWISMEAAMLLEEMGEEDTEGLVQPVKKFRKEADVKHTDLGRLRGMPIKTDKEMKIEEIQSLAKEFFGAPSAKWSLEGADMSVLEKWFEKLGVGWVLCFADGAAACKLEQTLDVSSWIRALTEIKDALRLTGSLFPGHGSSVKEEGPAAKETEEQEDIMTDQVQIASFAQQAILKLLVFVDFIFVPNLNITCQVSTIQLVAPYQKLYAMLRVYNALITGFSSYLPASGQVGRIQENVVGLLSAKKHKAGEAIWNTMEDIRNRILESVDDGNDSSGTQHPQGSPDVHKATRSALSYIRFLDNNSTWTGQIVYEAIRLGKYVPLGSKHDLLYGLIVEMVHCVQEKLANKSEKFTDQSLRFIFLLNNLSFMGDHYTSYLPASYNAVHTGKVVAYMESYMQVAWAPVLACLLNPKHLLLFRKKNSPLLKFESEFHKTYTTQKLWKVPDPKLRKTLRGAIIEKIVPDYTKYIEDNKVTTPSFTPGNVEEMLQELFEG